MTKNKYHIFFILFFIVFFTLFYWPSVQAFNTHDIEELDKFIQEAYETWGMPGMAVAVVAHDNVVFIKGYGDTELGSQKKINGHTVFQLASLSKTFASTLVGVLAYQKKLSLDKPIVKYLPNLFLGSEEQTSKITLRHVLSHTTGFPHHAGDPKIESGDSFKNIIDSFSNLKVISPPGKVYAYQNAIYALSGAVIEKVTNMSYEEALQTYLLDPLGMTDTSVGEIGLYKASNRVSPYKYTKNGHIAVPVSTNYYTVLPAAGVNSSAHDLAQWMLFQMGSLQTLIDEDQVGPEISLAMLQELQKPSISSPGETRRMSRYEGKVSETHYGLGWRIYNYAGHNVVCHGGMIRGAKSLLSFDPEKKIGIALLSNSTGPALGMIRSYFFDKIYDLPFIDYNKVFKEKQDEQPLLKKKKNSKKNKKKKSKR